MRSICSSVPQQLQVKVKLATVVEGDQKALFSIATTRRCWGERYFFPWIAPLYSWYVYCGTDKYIDPTNFWNRSDWQRTWQKWQNKVVVSKDQILLWRIVIGNIVRRTPVRKIQELVVGAGSSHWCRTGLLVQDWKSLVVRTGGHWCRTDSCCCRTGRC